MNTGRALIIVITAAMALLAASCGGGQTAGGGTGGTGMVARGAITSTTGDSLGVNAVTYRTTAATVITGATTLRTGMVVTLRGQLDADRLGGTAADIAYARTVVGRLLTADAATGFTVYGQQVVYRAPITFEDTDGLLTDAVPAWLMDGAAVEVSGFVRADGTVEASYVRQLDAEELSAIDFVGLVTGVEAVPDPTYVHVNGTRVNLPDGYDWSEEPIAAGWYVQVHAPAPADEHATALDADDIDVVDMGLSGEEGEEGEIEGVISYLAPDRNSFIVAGQTVTLTLDTEWEDGARQDELALDLHVEVEGHFDDRGYFVADEVEFE